MSKVILCVVLASLLVLVVSILQKLIMSLLIVLLECASFPLFELPFELLVSLVCSLCVFSCLLLLLFLLSRLALIHLKEIIFCKIKTFFMGLKTLISFLDFLEHDCWASTSSVWMVFLGKCQVGAFQILLILLSWIWKHFSKHVSGLFETDFSDLSLYEKMAAERAAKHTLNLKITPGNWPLRTSFIN